MCLSSALQFGISEISTILKLIMVVPATNAVSERSASALQRVKIYLRATMSQLRLNNLIVLHSHKEKTDSLDISACLNYFIEGNEHRIKIVWGSNSFFP